MHKVSTVNAIEQLLVEGVYYNTAADNLAIDSFPQ
jgi:hypothetical protein